MANSEGEEKGKKRFYHCVVGEAEHIDCCKPVAELFLAAVNMNEEEAMDAAYEELRTASPMVAFMVLFGQLKLAGRELSEGEWIEEKARALENAPASTTQFIGDWNGKAEENSTLH